VILWALGVRAKRSYVGSASKIREFERAAAAKTADAVVRSKRSRTPDPSVRSDFDFSQPSREIICA
jgi:hypothetical protein